MLRAKQQKVIRKILNRNADVVDEQSCRLDWKVCVYDDKAQWILSVLFKISAMNDVGVMSLEPISKDRVVVPSVDVIYLVESTEDNFVKIAADCRAGLYRKAYVNFLSCTSDDDMRQFASFVAHQSGRHCIHGVFDQFVGFCSIAPNIFVLRERDNFFLDIFGFKARDDLFENACREIGKGLADVFLTTSDSPRVLYKCDSQPSRAVVRSLWEKVRPVYRNLEFMAGRRDVSSASRTSPLLLILDRTCDLAGPLHHPNSYEALIHDQYGIVRGQCSISGKMYDLDTDLDPFWAESRTKAFGDVVSRNDANMRSFQFETGRMDVDLGAAVANLTDMQHRQRSLNTHTKIGEDIVKKVKAKCADELFRMEEDCFLQKPVSIEAMIKLLRGVPDQSDKLRFVSIAYLCDYLQKDDIERLASVVGCSLSFIDSYLSGFKIRAKNTHHVIGKLLSKISSQYDDDNNAVVASLPAASILKKVCKGELDEFCDHRGKQSGPLGDVKHVYVFIVGPGSYTEYNGLVHVGQELGVNVTYGCTSLSRPSEMLSQLMHLGE